MGNLTHQGHQCLIKRKQPTLWYAPDFMTPATVSHISESFEFSEDLTSPIVRCGCLDDDAYLLSYAMHHWPTSGYNAI